MNNKALALEMNKSISRLFRSSLRIGGLGLRYLIPILRAIRDQKEAAAKRVRFEEEGLHIPPFMIVSVTSRCNLNCKGCYARTSGHIKGTDLEDAELDKLFKEAEELGISIILLAGGEPLLRKDILKLAGRYPKIIFPLFTNGLLIDEDALLSLSRYKNIIPVFSIEGKQALTDDRRGSGVHDKLLGVFTVMKQKRLLYGTSITVTAENIGDVTDEEFIGQQVDSGCRLFFYVEYVPVEAGTEQLALKPEQEGTLLERLITLETKYPALFIAFPGDEIKYGGCLAAGRGFIHVNSSGGVEPCPFAPYSDVNLRDMSLREALKSGFLKEIRKNHNMLVENGGGCALWDKREWVAGLLDNNFKS